MCLPYCPEFRPVDSDMGRVRLDQIARITGGVERIQPADVWRDLTAQPRWVDITIALLLVAMVVILLEILERRTGAITSLTARMRGMRLPNHDRSKRTADDGAIDRKKSPTAKTLTTNTKASANSSSPPTAQPTTTKSPPKTTCDAADTESTSAFDQARNRANRRTQR
jgi:hypothetical protein